MLTLLRFTVSCMTAVPFNRPFSSNVSASRFDAIKCGPSHTAICPSCNWWSLLATLHSALFSDINQEASTQQHRVVFRRFSYTKCTVHFLITWKRPNVDSEVCVCLGGGNITLCHTVSTTFHKYIQLKTSLVQTRKHPAHITVKADQLCCLSCVI